MLLRFSLYGFLKNQRYYEPFLVLAFLEKGLSFFTIGVLVGFREACMNLFEVPSGAAADLYGRRRAMIASFSAYIVSFVVFAWSTELWMLFVALGVLLTGSGYAAALGLGLVLSPLCVLLVAFRAAAKFWNDLAS